MFSDKIKPDNVDDWKCVYETSIESEAGLVSGFLQNRGITCEILSKKDSAYTVNFGDLSAIFVYVPTDQAGEAEKALDDWKKGTIEEYDMDDSEVSDPDNDDDNDDK